MIPQIIKGNVHADDRGALYHNNNFNAEPVKRIYIIENTENFIRGWQGHKIEQRWFTAVLGKFLIKLVKIENWENPNPEAEIFQFELNSETLDVLHIPAGYCSCIRSKEPHAKLLVMADYGLGVIDDEYRYPINYFKN